MRVKEWRQSERTETPIKEREMKKLQRERETKMNIAEYKEPRQRERRERDEEIAKRKRDERNDD